ncbi:MAG: cytochrome c maturation protein CcmE [Bacteroidia bacterium]|nr:cytochrome c maturation protein CcmE [Bacteroidia bacterium]MCZ2249037.1 cytochrome c maturation protein CcmE [Bacteroidia bacterium]
MKKIHIIILVVIAISIAAIMGTVADSSTYASFRVALDNPGSEYHVVGKYVKDKGIEYNPAVNANKCVFYLKDNENKELKVIYKGPKPQDFEMSEQIVVTGKTEGNIFVADKILMKCPSKYNNTDDPSKTTTSNI